MLGFRSAEASCPCSKWLLIVRSRGMCKCVGIWATGCARSCAPPRHGSAHTILLYEESWSVFMQLFFLKTRSVNVLIVTFRNRSWYEIGWIVFRIGRRVDCEVGRTLVGIADEAARYSRLVRCRYEPKTSVFQSHFFQSEPETDNLHRFSF